MKLILLNFDNLLVFLLYFLGSLLLVVFKVYGYFEYISVIFIVLFFKRF